MHLFACIAMRLVTTVTTSAINKVKEPDNLYLQVSEKPAWKLLRKLDSVSPNFALASFRVACGYSAHPSQSKFEEWAIENTFKLTDMFQTLSKTEVEVVDLSV